MIVKCPFITDLVPGKVEKENHIRKVRKMRKEKLNLVIWKCISDFKIFNEICVVQELTTTGFLSALWILC